MVWYPGNYCMNLCIYLGEVTPPDYILGVAKRPKTDVKAPYTWTWSQEVLHGGLYSPDVIPEALDGSFVPSRDARGWKRQFQDGESVKPGGPLCFVYGPERNPLAICIEICLGRQYVATTPRRPRLATCSRGRGVSSTNHAGHDRCPIWLL